MAYTLYPATSVTVTNTAQSILALVRAKDANIKASGREITLQNDPTSTNNVRVGGDPATATAGGVSPTNCGYVLTPGASRTYRSDDEDNSAAFPNMYVVTDTGTAQLNVEIIRK